MKTIFYFKIGAFLFLIAMACESDPKTKDGVGIMRDSSAIHTCEIYKGDTCNRTDYTGRKQGKWYVFDKQHQLKDTLFYKNDVKQNKIK